ncbi:hypothetical protein HYPSUDRAFT_49753 [Hypholoma sublateritium FD-334 SS-4]|uniref:Uncharacterized protein n=1 Tax=Hypholoma sublateritium (strain FD-334 SS-4) TaxID=945553 RepID=A0A0D2NAG4_HYPSF|nr:hypothetical protein HYPSUDRAFT_49753 [Hypholoma sublateritium FD-334 SS-4]
MATPFSWSDTMNIAFGSCLPCLKPAPAPTEDSDDIPHNPAINRIPRARADELQGLLADPDTDIEAETLSLHSNPGRGRRSKKKRRPRTKKTDENPRRITLFGYDLFGRPAPPPIQLPIDDDQDDALYNSGPRDRLTSTTTSATTSTFDLDAAPLDADAIAAMSSPTVIATAAAQAADAEAQRLREKEERRQRRREKKELRRLAEALAAQNTVGDGEGAFEGFQGSGGGITPTAVGSRSGYPRIPNAMFRGPTSDSGSASGSGISGSPGGAGGGFGPFVGAPAVSPPPDNDEEDAAADLDGGMYARRAPRAAPGDGSDSRSRTSASRSDRGPQFPDPRAVVAHIQSQAYAARVASPSPLQSQLKPNLLDSASSISESFVTAESNTTSAPPAKFKKSKSSSSRTSRSHSSTTASQSPSIPSPLSPTFVNGVQDTAVVSPSTVEHGQGFFDLEPEAPVKRSRKGSSAYAAQFSKNENLPEEMPEPTSTFPVSRIGGGSREGFPSTGFGGAGASRARDFGVFLSKRGDDEPVSGSGL